MNGVSIENAITIILTAAFGHDGATRLPATTS
jgi:hypothetical protein